MRSSIQDHMHAMQDRMADSSRVEFEITDGIILRAEFYRASLVCEGILKIATYQIQEGGR
jgi:hypothetical protein